MQKCLIDSAQILKIEIDSNTNRINVERIDSLITLLRDH